MEDVINELRKLIEYTGKGNSIQKEYVDLITTKSLDAVIFDLTDNLGKRNITYCIDTLNELLMQKENLSVTNRPPVPRARSRAVLKKSRQAVEALQAETIVEGNIHDAIIFTMSLPGISKEFPV